MWACTHLAALNAHASAAFPGVRLIPIGSYSRGTAIAVHSNVDVLVVLPRAWATWGNRRVAPEMIITRMAQDLGALHDVASVSTDGRAIALSFAGVTQTVNVRPGFLAHKSRSYPTYTVPGRDREWVKVCPQRHDRLFAEANKQSNGKLAALSRLIKAWGMVTPSRGISSLYIDMTLATSGIASGVKSYGDCLADFFKVLARREARGLLDPAGGSDVIVVASSDGGQRLRDSVKAAADWARVALDAEARGEVLSARRHWKSLFKRRV